MTTSPRTIIQIARAGDILSVLPVAWKWSRQGRAVSLLTAPEFAPMLTATSYARATPEPFPGAHNGVGAALGFARERGYADPIATQVDGGEPLRPGARNFILDQWTRAGEAADFRRLPLVLDARREREDKAVLARFPFRPGRPVLAYCLDGHSSKFAQSAEFERWLIEAFGGAYQLFPFGHLRFPTLMDLHPLLARCHRLITIDTGPLHLSYASMVPTIALSLPTAWYRSEPRAHWLEHLTYPEALGRPGQERIRAAVTDAPSRYQPRPGTGPSDPARPVVHLVNTYNAADGPSAARMARARATWANLAAADPGYTLAEYRTPARHSGTDMADPRALPYLHDMLDWGCTRAGPGGIVMFTNADISLAPEACDAVRLAMDGWPCCHSHPADVVGALKGAAVHRHELARYIACSGTGLFAFTPAWWASVRESIPPLFIGAEGWDAVFRWTMEAANPAGEVLPPVSWHERHWAYWQAHLRDEPAQQHNRRLCREWAMRNGRAAYLDPKGAPIPYLFGATPQ